MMYTDKEYVMLIDGKQNIRIDQAINDIVNVNYPVTAEHIPLPDGYWSEATRIVLQPYNARFGVVIKKYNPYYWRRELIFKTEQDAVKFCLKVL